MQFETSHLVSDALSSVHKQIVIQRVVVVDLTRASHVYCDFLIIGYAEIVANHRAHVVCRFNLRDIDESVVPSIWCDENEFPIRISCRRPSSGLGWWNHVGTLYADIPPAGDRSFC
jgi:hypothetical protein